MAKRGRPSTYDESIAQEICRRLSDGEALGAICRDEHMPPQSTVRAWALDDTGPGFAARYARARDIGIDCQVDELLALVRDESVQTDRARLIADTLKWRICKLAPKRYGDRLNLEATGADGGPIKSTVEVVFVSAEKGKE